VEEKNKIVEEKTKSLKIKTKILPIVSIMQNAYKMLFTANTTDKRKFPNSFVLYNQRILLQVILLVRGIRNTVFIAAADCTGHGVPGAMVLLYAAML